MRRNRLAVIRNDRGGQVLEPQAEDTGIRGVDQPQPQALAGPHGDRPGRAAVDRDGVAHAAFVADVMPVAEVVADRAVVLQPPVVEDPKQIAVDFRRRRLFHDQRAIEAAGELHVRAQMRVIPKRAGVRRDILVDKTLAGLHRRLGQLRHAVHRVRDAKPMPMDRGRLLQLVLEFDTQLAALAGTDHRAGHLSAIAPDRGLAGRFGLDAGLRGQRRQLVCIFSMGAAQRHRHHGRQRGASGKNVTTGRIHTAQIHDSTPCSCCTGLSSGFSRHSDGDPIRAYWRGARLVLSQD